MLTSLSLPHLLAYSLVVSAALIGLNKGGISIPRSGLPLSAWSQGTVETSVPAPVGRLVDLGGRGLHQLCSGAGSPVVLIENGAAAFAVDWVHVQTEASKFTQVCTYDRAGYAWSDRGPAQDAIEETMDDLHLLLAKTDVRPPFVMVGASLGAIYVRAYQRRFPEHVAGLVFVDGTHDEAITFMSEGRRMPISQLSAEQLPIALSQYEKEAPRPSAGKPDQEPLNRLPPDLQRRGTGPSNDLSRM